MVPLATSDNLTTSDRYQLNSNNPKGLLNLNFRPFSFELKEIRFFK